MENWYSGFLYIISQERDRCVGGMIHAVQEFWNETPLDDLLYMSKDDITVYLSSLADEYSNDLMEVTVNKEWIHFESLDERAKIR